MHTETKNLGKAKALGILPAVAALMVEPHQYPSYQLILITQGTIPEIFATFLGELQSYIHQVLKTLTLYSGTHIGLCVQ